MIAVDDLARWFQAHDDAVGRALTTYYTGTGRAAFSGRWFDRLAGTGDPNRFTANDLVDGWDDVDELELATLTWVHWFNDQRLHSHCDDVPPTELEAAFDAAQQPEPAGVGNQ